MATSYDEIGVGYSNFRRADPRIEARVLAALGDARTVVNVGAGAGSYEPRNRWVLAIEPSAVMRGQRPPDAAPAIAARAEALPLDDSSVDAALACMTIHHWADRAGGLRELVRVARQRVVVLTYDIPALDGTWLIADYAPEILDVELAAFGPIEDTCAVLGESGASVRVEAVPIPADCTDGFIEGWFARPEALLDPAVRRAQSIWPRLPAGVEQRAITALARDLADGTWDDRHGHMRSQPQYEGGMRLVIADLDAT